MDPFIDNLLRIALVGILATAVMDAWLLILKRLKLPTLDFALLGRWVLHGARGRFVHRPIAASPRMRAERCAGWLAHYAVGVGFALLLVTLAGAGWLRQPTWPTALAFGAATVLVPLLVMQPAMGAGIASSRTATPLRNVVRSLANHIVFGAGLYLAARLLERT